MSNSELPSLESYNFELYTTEIKRWLVPYIISDRSLHRIQQVLDTLPGKTTNAIGLEFQSFDSVYDCDLSLSIDPYVNINELTSWNLSPLDNNCQNNHQLINNINQVSKIANAWKDPKTKLYEIIRELFLEMDITAPCSGKIPLNIFLTLLVNHDHEKIITLITANLLDTVIGDFQYDLTLCLNKISKLPKELCITHLGFMLGRPSQAIRVLIRCNSTDLSTVMPTLGINPSEYVACIDFLSIIQPKCSYIVIAINMFRYGIGTDFSIECGLVDTLQDNADAWWSDFLCSINALGNWEKHFSKMRLVETLKKKRIEDLTLTNIGCNKIDWGLNHLKINFSKKELPNLKWYIGMYGFNTSVSSQNRSNIKWNG